MTAATFAALPLGAADAAFEMTSEYLKVRKQFGQLIGSFQSLQHRAAIMFTELELTRSCVASALEALDRNANNTSELASLAKAKASETLHLVSNEMVQMHGGIGMTDAASETLHLVSKEMVQMHGGIGMTDAHDAGLYLKRARVAEALYGGASFHRGRYATLLNY